MRLAYTYQRIMDEAATINTLIADVRRLDADALGARGYETLDVVAKMNGVAAWIARDRRDALMPIAADTTILIPKRIEQ